ncbi:MAG TPA: hypothetical protein EYO33_07080 [Phycisphaerales bacterium]|nr:hypothetical protein [Phycisphaerales bacterium]
MRTSYQLWRQDDNGNEFMIETFLSENEAEEAKKEFEAKGHKQMYWVREQSESITRERVREGPQVFLGGRDEEALSQLVCEVISNSIDVFLRGEATELAVEVEGAWFRVVDNGTHFSRTQAKKFLTTYHQTAATDAHNPHIRIGQAGVGLFPVNCCCSRFEIESEDDEGGWRLVFREGVLESEESIEPPDQTTVTGVADTKLFEAYEIPEYRLRRLLFEGVHLFPGLTVTFQEEKFYSENGLSDLAAFEAQSDLTSLNRVLSKRHFGYSYADEHLSFTFACRGSAREETRFISWVNGGLTGMGGSHVEGVKDAIYGLEWKPAVALIHVVMREPLFHGLVKDALSVPGLQETVRDALLEPIQDYILEQEDSDLKV